MSARQADAGWEPSWRWGRLVPRLGLVLASATALGFAVWMTGRHPAGCNRDAILALEFAGEKHAERAYRCWMGHERVLAHALAWDWLLLIPVYVATLILWARRARATAITAHGRTIADAAIVSAVMAGALDAVENGWLWLLNDDAGRNAVAATGALTFTLPKWILLAFGAYVAVQGVLRTIGEARTRTIHAHVERPDGANAWERNTRLPPEADGATNIGPPRGTGIALSGGGIRSASFGIGALQALHDTPRTGSVGTLDDVRYISGVSGGGYLVGARQLLLASDDRVEPFRDGSYEVEYVRRHGRYIADSASEWIEALARIIAGVVLNAGFLVGLLYVIAIPSGWFQRSYLFPGEVDGFSTSAGMWLSVALMVGLAAASYLAAVVSRPFGDTEGGGWGSRLYRLAGIFAATGVICLALVFLLPAVAEFTGWLVESLRVRSSTLAASGGLLSALATWIGLRPPTRSTLSRLLKKDAARPSADMDDTKKTEHLKRKTLASKVRLSRWLPGLLLVLTAVFVLARFVARARRDGAGSPLSIGDIAIGSEQLLWAGSTIALLLLFALADQTTWSLHPFYKRRLATAFALMRMGGREVERRPYRLSTPLHTMGKATRGPKLILGAAANLSGEAAPPGRRALAFSFTSDWVGGPEIGYVPPITLTHGLGQRNAGDGTLVAAMAISGAALASAMGRHALGSLNSVMAAFNLRLGVWLPAPFYLQRVATGERPAPGRRRLTYVMRELFGSYDKEDRFLYVTDGGHVENLGVVELLRRRCETVFCFDGSGGPDTLLEGVRLAYEELGVTIEFPPGSYATIREGSASPDVSTAKDVAARMSATSVLVGTIRYPALSDDFPAGTGTIVYARSVLTPRTSAELLDHATRNARFPNDPTGDQWFDVEQFNNYVALGREVGLLATQAAGR